MLHAGMLLLCGCGCGCGDLIMKFSIIYTDVDNVEKPAAVERKDRGGEKNGRRRGR